MPSQIDQYLTYLEREVGARRSTVATYRTIIDKLPAAFPAGMEGTRALRTLMQERWSDAAPRTLRKVRSALVSYLDWQVEEGIREDNPARALRQPKIRSVERPTFTPTQVDKIIASQKRPADRLAVLLVLRLALRKTELSGVRRRDIDEERWLLSLRPEYAKGGKAAVLPLATRELRSAARPLLELEPDEYLLCPEKRGPGAGRYGEVRTLRREAMSPKSGSGMQRWWNDCLERAGVGPGSLHVGRHTALTAFHRDNGDLILTQALARHSSPLVTRGYVHDSVTDLAAALRRGEEA